jgi:AMME syndrome candidate gene 1 protein
MASNYFLNYFSNRNNNQSGGSNSNNNSNNNNNSGGSGYGDGQNNQLMHYQNPLLDQNYLSSNNEAGASSKVICDDMIYYCFDVLNSHLHRHQDPLRPMFTNSSFPLFVTWYIGREKKLRGCIGTFTPLSLHDGLKEYAITSAIRDTRFSPISKEELAKLNCSVSLLTNFEPAKNWSDWHIGKHGIRIDFYNEKGQKRSATYLPEIASEQNWDHKETIDSLMRKGGYKSTITNDIRNQLSVTRYQSEKMTRSFQDWQRRNSTNSLNQQF